MEFVRKNIRIKKSLKNYWGDFMKSGKDEIEDKIEDSTKYGEFVSSYFAWLTLDGQKERANDLNKMIKKEKGK